MVRKLNQKKRQDNKQAKIYEKDVKSAVEGSKPLGKPLPNKFLTLLIKDTILNDDKKKSNL